MKVICFLLFSLFLTCKADLESVSDEELVNVFKQETHVVVLFSKKNCDDCDVLEKLLSNLKDDFKDNLSSQVLKAFNSQLVRLYSPKKEPAVVFFRHGVPLLYDGPANEDTILQTFIDNSEPNVKELSDANFEHLTQASTGSTTGDWFIMFYTQECVDCQRLTAVWESVAASVKRRMNVARVNSGGLGTATGARFSIKNVPEFILIRQGKFYRYTVKKYDVKSLISFGQEWYRNSTPEKIQLPATPFDEAVNLGVKYLKLSIDFGFKFVYDYWYLVLFVVIGFALTFTIALITSIKAAKKNKKETNKKE